MRDVIYHDRPRVSPAHKAIRIAAVLIAAAVILMLGVILFTRMDLDMNRQAVESGSLCAVLCHRGSLSFQYSLSGTELRGPL